MARNGPKHSYLWEPVEGKDYQRKIGCRFCGVESRWHNSKFEWRRPGEDWSRDWIPCPRVEGAKP